MVLWRPTRPSRTNTKKKKDVLFIIGDWNAKVGSQEIPGVTGKFGLGVQNEAGQRLTEFCQGNALVIANTIFQQHKRWLYTWTSPYGQYKTQIDYILCSWRKRSSIQSAKTRTQADCGSDHELLIAKKERLVTQSCLTLWFHGLQPVLLLCPWRMSCSFLSAPGKSTVVGCHFFFHRIFPTQGSNPGLWHCRHIILPAEAQGKHRHNLRSGFHWGSKPGPSACKADMLTTILWNHELFRVKLKKVGKTTRTFRCDLN